jgi:exopolysaccharide biosynthesis polyprenyl glycosylphosphotransferase
VVDVLMLALVAGLIALVSPTVRIPPEPLVWAALFPFVVVALFHLRGMYSPPLRLDQLEALRLVVTGSALATMIVMSARTVTADGPWVAAETVRHWLIALPFLTAGRWALMWIETRDRRQGASTRPTLIVGSGRVGQLTAKRLLDDPALGLRPVGFLDEDPPPADGCDAPLPVFDARTGFEDLVGEHGVSHVIVAFSSAPHTTLLALVRRCWQLGVTVSVVPRLWEVHGEDVVLEHLGNLPLMDLRPADPHGLQFKLKYAIDRVGAAVALAVLSPLIALTALVVLIGMGRPVLYRQRRVGRDGSIFDMYKFRTMAGCQEEAGDADADWAAEQLGAVPRARAAERHVPRAGAALRRFSLDELPQLWNVLRGDMSLIGPRPERAHYVHHFERGIYRYVDRHRVKSGLTGWAQVHNLRGRTSLADRVEWDNHYIENWSIWLDLKIALMTIPCLLRGRGD